MWSYHHGDGQRYRGAPAHFWEIYDGVPVTGTTLEILTEDPDAGRAIYRSQAATSPISLFRSRNAAYWKAVGFVRRRLDDLARHGFGFIESLETYRQTPHPDVPVQRTPTNAQMLRFLLRLGPAALRSLWWRVNRRQWLLAYRPRGPERWTLVTPPRDRFYADPFLIEHDGDHVLFFEDYPYRRARGSSPMR